MSQEVWSVDPGTKRIGFARWTDQGDLIEKKVFSEDALFDLLEDGIDKFKFDGRQADTPKIIVCEQWAFRPGQTGRGDKMVSSQVIGALKLFAKMVGAKLVFQDSSILRVTAMHSGTKVPAGHIPDDVSAYLHGFYYFESIGVLKARAIW